MKPDKETQELLDYAYSKGFTLVRWKRHLVLRRGGALATVSKSPSCPYALENARKDIDRALSKTEDVVEVTPKR